MTRREPASAAVWTAHRTAARDPEGRRGACAGAFAVDWAEVGDRIMEAI
jgi:hypothetical protein